MQICVISCACADLQPADSGYLGCRIGLPSVNLERFTQLTVQGMIIFHDIHSYCPDLPRSATVKVA